MSPTTSGDQPEKSLRGIMASAGFASVEEYDGPRTRLNRIRRTGRTAENDRMLTLTLVERDGVLYWEDDDVPAGAGSPHGFRGWGGGYRGRVIERFLVRAERPLEPSDVFSLLASADDGFNRFNGASTGYGLKQWRGNALQPAGQIAGKSLLFVHGTFSNASNLFAELTATTEGRRFLQAAGSAYSNILAFDHQTLSVSPALNALDLARATAALKDPIDVVSHSRGGLVTRWWFEGFGAGEAQRRAVLVGCPLNGTSLAAPPRLRDAMSFLSNLNRALASGADALSPVAPFLTVLATVFRIAGTLAGAAAKTPVIDAATAMVPGLCAMSRISNNFELQRIRVPTNRPYWFVRSNFEPKELGWKFWEVFVDAGARAENAAADMVFREENDLVVDTASMTDMHLAFTPTPERVLDFGTTNTVFHTNYFRQPKTLDFIRKAFGF